MSDQLVFAIEADDLLPGVTTVHCIVTKNRRTKEVRAYHERSDISPKHGTIADGVEALLGATRVWGHNILRYDIPAIQKCGLMNMATAEVMPDELGYWVRDTLLMSQVAWPDIEWRKDLPWPHKREKYKSGKTGPIKGYSLEQFGKRLGCHKGDPGGSFKVFTQQMLDYCIQDVEVNSLLADCLEDPAYFLGMEPYSDDLWWQEHVFAHIMFLQQQHGWPFDIAAASRLQAELQQKKDELYDLLAPLVEPEVVYGKIPQYYMHPEYPGKKWPTKGDCYNYLQKNKTERTLKERSGEIVDGPVMRKEIPWNPGSRDQVKKLLYREYNWKPTKWADKKGNVKDHVHPKEWADLLEKDWHEVIDDDVLRGLNVPELEPLADYFMVSKILSMLATGDKAHMKFCGADNRIHGEVNGAKVLGGRCGHSSPNVAQVPACHPKKPYNAKFRALYHCLPGHKQVGFDASALELRIMAHWGYTYDNGDLGNLVDDPEKDIHWELCKRYGIARAPIDAPRDESNHVWEGWRSAGKPLTYGIPYGAQAP